MNLIELEQWKPSEKDPRRMEYAGQRTAQEVFEELKYRLESTGYLPDEYFLMDAHWENGREIPKSADIFCTTDYGSSEGVYLDVYLKWYEDGKSIIKSFATGKTLGDSGNDMDRMFLISSAITKAFHGDRASHARYMKIGGAEEEAKGMVVHLSTKEQQTVIEALVEQREHLLGGAVQAEQLLRRMTGGVMAFVDLVGQRPLRLDSYDKTIFAIHDGDLDAFKEHYLKAMEQTDFLLIEAAGRPGEVGRKMTLLVLSDGGPFSESIYRAACRKAVDISDMKKVLFLLEQVPDFTEDLPLSFYGELAGYAYTDHRMIAVEIIRQCTEEQIAAAPPYLLELFASEPNYLMLETLVEKGISSRGSAERTLHMLTYKGQNSWIARDLLEERMWVEPDDYPAFHACVQNDAVRVCELLLDGGMDFDGYRQWAKGMGCAEHEETLQALAEHWAELHQAPAQEEGGMTLG